MRTATMTATRIGIGIALVLSIVLPAAAAWAQPPDDSPGEESTACELIVEGEAIEKLVLKDGSGQVRVLTDPGTTVSLPPGTYRLQEVHLQDGYRCRLYGSGDENSFRAVPGRPHHLKVGAPLTPKVRVTSMGNRLTLRYQLVDAAGHPYVGGQSKTPPRFAIYKGGKQIGSGSFEYG